ncbi:hypothetical protein PFISCL1PPCAC_24981, partial [Pristionchus fissidentatus]
AAEFESSVSGAQFGTDHHHMRLRRCLGDSHQSSHLRSEFCPAEYLLEVVSSLCACPFAKRSEARLVIHCLVLNSESLESLLEIEENVVGDILFDEITSIRTIVDHFTIDGYRVFRDAPLSTQYTASAVVVLLADGELFHFYSTVVMSI